MQGWNQRAEMSVVPARADLAAAMWHCCLGATGLEQIRSGRRILTRIAPISELCGPLVESHKGLERASRVSKGKSGLGESRVGSKGGIELYSQKSATASMNSFGRSA